MTVPPIKQRVFSYTTFIYKLVHNTTREVAYGMKIGNYYHLLFPSIDNEDKWFIKKCDKVKPVKLDITGEQLKRMLVEDANTCQKTTLV